MPKQKYSALVVLVFLFFLSFNGIHNNGNNFNSYPGDSLTILYKDVSLTNLPFGIVSGPGMDVEAADLDADGDLDVVIANEYQPNKILLNNGSGVFTDGTPGRLPQKNLDSEDIGIADMDRDNDLDIVFATEDHAIHELYFNNGNAVYRDKSNVLPGSIANSVLAIDINNDSLPDLIFGNAGPSDTPARNFILINNGDSTFTNETSTRMPNVLDITQDVKLADIDGDMDKDIIVGNEDGNKIHINNGSGFFTDETSVRLPLTGFEETRKVTLADVDGDNDLDIFFANVAFRPAMQRQDRLLKNNGSGVFADVTSANLPVDQEHTTDGIFIDVDYDGDLDLITTNIFVNRPVKVFLNNGSGVFEERTTEILPAGVQGEGIGIKAADFNGDHLLDLYICNRGQQDRLLFRNDTAKTIGIYQIGNEIPNLFSLGQNYPNPFNPVTNFDFSVPQVSTVKIEIFDTAGRNIETLAEGEFKPGIYKAEWNAANYPSGVYFYKLASNGFSQTRKMILLK